jgi:Protein of unknown function (DUF4230)
MPETEHPSPRSVFPWVAGVLLGGAFAAGALAAAFHASSGASLLQLFEGRKFVEVSQPVVVRQIQQLQRLETVRYTMDKIISGEHDNPYLPKFLVSDRLLLVVHGEVIGGMDLSKIAPGDVSVSGRSVSIRLPKAEILVTHLDNSQTRVYSRDTGLFSAPDPNLESEVRQEAERQLQQAALQDGVLKTADENARGTVTSILRGLGFESVEFR